MTCRTLYLVSDLRRRLDDMRAGGKAIAVVPTMGALHEGHLSLVRRGAELAEEVVVTIFVNPTQFGPGEDLDTYPRQLDADTKLAASAGATIVFAPPEAEMYPEGEQTRVEVPGMSKDLCGLARPQHFRGVTTVVAKLFNAAGPGVYVFGRKDYQQWRIIETMARDLFFPVEVLGLPTVREPDGLAMSSRNAYLSPDERARAAVIPRALQAAISAHRDGQRKCNELVALVREIMSQDVEVDYVEVRNSETLAAPATGDASLLIAVAARVGAARLIDNVVLGPDTADILEGGRS